MAACAAVYGSNPTSARQSVALARMERRRAFVQKPAAGIRSRPKALQCIEFIRGTRFLPGKVCGKRANDQPARDAKQPGWRSCMPA